MAYTSLALSAYKHCIFPIKWGTNITCTIALLGAAHGKQVVFKDPSSALERISAHRLYCVVDGFSSVAPHRFSFL